MAVTHMPHVELFLAYMQQLQSQLLQSSQGTQQRSPGAERFHGSQGAQSPQAADSSDLSGQVWRFHYLFLVPSGTPKLSKLISGFCADQQAQGQCALHEKPIDQPAVTMDWQSIFKHFQALPSDSDAVFVLRSNCAGPVLPGYLKALPGQGVVNIFSSYLQYLTPTSPVVLSDLFVAYRRRRAVLALHAAHYPLLLTAETARMLATQPQTGKRWIMSLLSVGLNIAVLQPRYRDVDWLRYYTLCWLKPATAVAVWKECKSLDSVIMNDAPSLAYEAHLNQLVESLDMGEAAVASAAAAGATEQSGNKGNVLDKSIRTFQDYGAYVSFFVDISSMASESYGRLLDGIRSHTLAVPAQSQPHTSTTTTIATTVTKTLVIYVYHESTPDSIANFLHFTAHGLVPTDAADFIILVQGKATVRMPSQFNVQVIHRPNECFDIGSWGQVITALYAGVGVDAQGGTDADTGSTAAGAFSAGGGANGKTKYSKYIVLNSSVRGPYLPPIWPFPRLWTEAFTSQLNEQVKLIGLSVNCPDGLGRKIPHLMSMLLAFDQVTVDVWMAHDKPSSAARSAADTAHTATAQTAGAASAQDFSRPQYQNISSVLFCAKDKLQSYRQEADLSLAVLQAGYDIKSMQTHYKQSWQSQWQKIQSSPFTLHRGHNICAGGVLLDVFFKKGWSFGETTPHPYDFMFIKTNRDIYEDLRTLDYLATDYRQFPLPVSATALPPAAAAAAATAPQTAAAPAAPPSPTTFPVMHSGSGYVKAAVLISHNLQYEGAPMWLLRIGTVLMSHGYTVKVLSLEPGPLGAKFTAEGMEVLQLSTAMPFVQADAPQAFSSWLTSFYSELAVKYSFRPTLLLFNTVLFVRTISILPLFQRSAPRVVWAIHESELFDAIKGSNNYAYAHDFKELLTLGSVYLGADRMLFVSDSGKQAVCRAVV